MRRIRRRLMRTYANLDIPIEWKDDAVAEWAKGKELTTRRDVMGYKKAMAGKSGDGFPKSTVRYWPELRWFVNAPQWAWGGLNNAKNLVEIRYPEHWTCVTRSACDLSGSALTFFEFPLAATSTVVSMFMECAQLKRVRLSPGMAKFNDNTFDGCNVLEMTEWPETLTFVGHWCFSSPLIKKLRVLAKTPPTLRSKEAFVYTSWPQMYVPDESVEAYKAADIWSGLASKIHPMSEWVDE
jgi:hypothetical protein